MTYLLPLLITIIVVLLFIVWCLGRAVAYQHRRADYYMGLWKRAMANRQDNPDKHVVIPTEGLVAWYSADEGLGTYWRPADCDEWPEEIDA